MFKNLGNMAEMFKQAQEMQKKLAESQGKLDTILVVGTAGADMVTVEMTGKGTVKTIKIDPKLLNPDDVSIVQDLIIAAMNDAKEKSEKAASEEMEKITSGLSLPAGFKLPF